MLPYASRYRLLLNICRYSCVHGRPFLPRSRRTASTTAASCIAHTSWPDTCSSVNIHVPVRVIGMPGQREAAGEVYGGSGIGGIHGLPARASWMAVRTWAPCLAAVEM